LLLLQAGDHVERRADHGAAAYRRGYARGGEPDRAHLSGAGEGLTVQTSSAVKASARWLANLLISTSWSAPHRRRRGASSATSARSSAFRFRRRGRPTSSVLRTRAPSASSARS